MTATPGDRPVASHWYLRTHGGSSSLRIVDGLAIRESAAGALQVVQSGTDAWLRFEQDGDAMFLRAAPDWQLVSGREVHGDQVCLSGPMIVMLRHQSIEVSSTLASTADTGSRTEVALVRRPSPVRAPPRSGGGQITPDHTTLRSAADLTARNPGLARAPASREVLWSPDLRVGHQQPPADASEATAARGSPGTPAPVIAAGGPSTTRKRVRARVRRRRSTVGAGWWVRSAITVTLLSLSPFLTSPETPWADPVTLDAQPPPAAEAPSGWRLVDQAEALLSAHPEDVAILQFAVESYRLESLRGSRDPEMIERMSELEARLSGATPSLPMERADLVPD